MYFVHPSKAATTLCTRLALLTAATAQCERKYPGRSSLQNLLFYVYTFEKTHYSARLVVRLPYDGTSSIVLLSKCIVYSCPFQQYLTCSLSTKYHEPCGISPNLWNLNCTLIARGVRLSRTLQGNRCQIATERSCCEENPRVLHLFVMWSILSKLYKGQTTRRPPCAIRRIFDMV